MFSDNGHGIVYSLPVNLKVGYSCRWWYIHVLFCWNVCCFKCNSTVVMHESR